MKRTLVLAGLLAFAALLPTEATEVVSDSYSRKLLERELLAGGELHYPVEAGKKKEGGTCGCLMHLGPTGHVISLRVISSSGHVILDN